MVEHAAIILSVIALIVSLTTFVVARIHQLNDRRKSLTVEMWKRWEDPRIRSNRLLFWRSITDNRSGDTPPAGSIEPTKLSAECLGALNEVEHFLDGLSELRRANQLDPDLLDALFAAHIKDWLGLSSAVSRAQAGNLLRSQNSIDALYTQLGHPGSASQRD
ncbi:MAG: hypothetical protein AAGC71_02455 [Pseudomonadota bacterium]